MILFISPKYGLKSDTVSLIEAARKRNIETVTLLNSFNKETYFKDKSQRALVYGEGAFCEFLAQEMKLNLYQNTLNWVAKLPYEYVNRNIELTTLKNLLREEELDQSILGRKYLEPADQPCFMPGIYTECFPDVPLDTQILSQSYIEWIIKYRFIIINSKIVNYCCYRLHNIFNVPTIWETEYVSFDKQNNKTTAKGFVNTLINKYTTAPSCIIDVGYTNNAGQSNAGWSVVGTYPVWSAELYGCSSDALLDGIINACQPTDIYG